MPFAAGREAEVYALGGGRLLRRYRDGRDAGPEAELMAYVGGCGFPVPEVFAARGADLIMERVDGPTMAEAVIGGELGTAECAEIMAGLLRRLHELPARDGSLGDTIVHLDLHPENVVLAARGPVVLDWANSGDGDGNFDTVLSALILGQVAVGAAGLPLGDCAGAILDRFLQVAPGDPVRMLGRAVEMRGRQATMTAAKVAELPLAAARVRGEQGDVDRLCSG